jgi:hypothetical protein
MSQGLEDYKMKQLGSIEDLSEAISRLSNFQAFCSETTPSDRNYYEQIEITERLVKTLFCEDSTEKLMEAFIEVAMESGLNLDSLYRLYVGKNILNQFRQDHGYKEGTYIKIWNNEEDNVIMQRLLETNSDITPQALYQALEEAYPKKG